MSRPLRTAAVATLSLLLGACGPKPSPLAGGGPVDRVTISHRANSGTFGPAVTSTDTARIATILRLAGGSGDWDGSWNTPPAGDHSIALFRGDSLLGTVRFAPTFLLVKVPAGSESRAIDSSEYAALLRATSWWPPMAIDYPATDTLVGPAAPIDYAADPDARRFRSTLESARKEPADFAGHYKFVAWGCGTHCTSHVILDLRTGRDYDDTLVNFSCGSVEYQRTSTLVITSPDTLDGDGGICAVAPRRFFSWDGTKLVELHPDPSQVAQLPAVSVVDSILRIPLRSGGTVKLVSHTHDDADVRQFSYDRYFRHAGFHGVRVSYYEAIEYRLIDDSTGRQFTIADDPVASPSGDEFVVASMGLDSDIQGNSLSIIRAQGDSVVPEWSTVMLTEWGAERPVWVSEDTIKFTRVWAAELRKVMPETPAQLIRKGKGWIVRGVVPDSLPEDTTEVH